MVLRTMEGKSTYVLVVISPEIIARPVVTSVSHATRPVGSSRRTASKIASEIWSAILSGCPSVTDSEVKKGFPLLSINALLAWVEAGSKRGRLAFRPDESNGSAAGSRQEPENVARVRPPRHDFEAADLRGRFVRVGLENEPASRGDQVCDRSRETGVSPAVGRIGEHEVEPLPRAREIDRGGPRVFREDSDLSFARCQPDEVRFEGVPVALDEYDLRGPPREGLQSDRATSREEVEHADPGDRVLQDVEEGLAGATRSRPGASRNDQSPPLPAAGHDADRGRRLHSGGENWYRSSSIFTNCEYGSITPTISTNPFSFSSLRTRKTAPSKRFRSVPGASTSGVNREAGARGLVKIVFSPSSAARRPPASAESADRSSKRTRF